VTSTWLLARNDVRALLPLWGSVMLIIVAGSLFDRGMAREIAFLAYGAGSVALVAHAFGHEYAHRTLAVLLAQPVDRRRIFLTKLGVAAPMLLALAVVAYATLLAGERPDWFDSSLLAVPMLVISGALFVAPLLTMICRGSLAGAVFTASVPGFVAFGAALVGAARFGIDNEDAVSAFQETWFWRLMPIIIVICGVASWRMFLNLEAIEGGHRQVDLRTWLSPVLPARAAAPTARRHPVWQLVWKELHLQQMSFVVAAIHVLIVGAVLLWFHGNPKLSIDVFVALTLMYGAGEAMLIGALASAEERHLGTLEWQMLLPIAAWRQWAVKAAVVIALTLAFSVALPALFIHVVRGIDFRTDEFIPLLIMLMLAITSLYASSLSTSGVRALILSVPFVLGGWFFFRLGVGGGMQALRAAHAGRLRGYPAGDQTAVAIFFASVGVLAALLLRFGYLNHRSVDPPLARAVRQVPWLAAFVVVAVALVMFVAMQRW
jgi:hypothetical protein